jgi:TctA family transporter
VWALIASLYIGNVMLLVVAVLVVPRLLKKRNPAGG